MIKQNKEFFSKKAPAKQLNSSGVIFKSSLMCTSQGGRARDMAVHISGHVIQGVGSAEEIIEKNPDVLVIDASDYIILPGLINSHTHVAMSFLRGAGHNVDQMIRNFNFKKEDKLSPQDIKAFSFGSLISALKSGTTCVFDHFYQSDFVASAVDQLGMRAMIGETILDRGGPKNIIKPFKQIKKELENWKYPSRIQPCIAPHATDTVSEGLFKEIGVFAQSTSLPVHMHLSQTRQEFDDVKKEYGCSPVELIKKYGLLNSQSLLVHLLHFNDQDLSYIKKSGAQVVSCPNSQIIYENIAPIDRFIDKDLPLSIATDCAASNDHMNVLSEAKMFKQMLRHLAPKTHEQVSPVRLLEMISSEPAKIFPDKQVQGQIIPGNVADLVFVRPDIRTAPMTDDLTHLFFSFETDHVQHVMVDGKWVVWHKNLVGVNEGELYEAFQEQSKNINTL